MIFLLALIGPILVAIFAKRYFGNEISKRETVAQIGIGIAIGFIVSALLAYGQLYDNEIITGEITSKQRIEDSYEESYDCNCRSVKSGDSTTTVCDTCWRTIYTIDWYLKSTIGDIPIDSESSEWRSVWNTPDPVPFTTAKVGTACSIERSYQNYIKASPDSLFNSSEFRNTSFDESIPAYPSVYMYYKLQHALTADAAVTSDIQSMFTQEVRKRLKRTNVNSHPNIIFVFTKDIDRNFRYALERKWLGGKKNDLIVVIGTANYPNVSWSEVITLGSTSGNELTAVKIQQAVESTDLDPVATVQNVFDVVAENFDMKSIEDFKYLQDEQEITFWQAILIVLASIVISIIVSILFARNTIRSNT